LNRILRNLPRTPPVELVVSTVIQEVEVEAEVEVAVPVAADWGSKTHSADKHMADTEVQESCINL
jgi:hypothetical protein